MAKTEICELTVLCLIRRDGMYLLQDRVKADWRGFTLPGGHIEPGESVVDAVIREMKEETGLTIREVKLCGIKQFPIDGGRYIVFLFTCDDFEGELTSSDEGAMHWVAADDIGKVNAVKDLDELLAVMTDDRLNEFRYVVGDDGKWQAIIR